jgi:hypothetical protein
MALANYSDLVTALTAWGESRGDISGIEDDAVRLAEAHLNLELRSREMLASTDITLTDGVGTLPTDFLGAHSVILKTTPRRVLDQVTYESQDAMTDTTQSGTGCTYSIYGESIRVAPRPTQDVELLYYQEIPNLESNSTNWLMTKYPNIYLTACQMEIYRYLREDRDMEIEAQRLQAMIQDLDELQNTEAMATSERKPSFNGLVF